MEKYKVLGLIVTLIMIFFSCEELPDPAGVRGVGVVPGIEDLDPGVFDSKDLSKTYVEFTLTLPAGSSAEKVNIVGFLNDSNVETRITEVSSFPSVIRILLSDVAQKIGISLSDIENGDIFTFILLPTVNGKTYHSSAVLTVPVACAFNTDLSVGSYHSVQADWPWEDNVTLAADEDDPFTIYISGLANLDDCGEDLGPYMIHINPATFIVTAEKKLLVSDYYGYGGITYSGSGVYNSCDGSYVLNIDISVGGYGSQGIFKFVLTRNP